MTFSAAALGFAYQQRISPLLLVAAGSAFVFWMVETIWKDRQRAFYPRILEIERWFAAQSVEGQLEPFQILTRWRSEFIQGRADWTYTSSTDRWWMAYYIPFFLHVMMPHLVIIAVGVLLYLVAPPGPAAG